jgi:hypothetical protein
LSDNREVAKSLILEAGNIILKERPGVHGSAENSFQMIADMWSTYIRHTHYARTLQEIHVELRPVDVAQMMASMKQARAVYGDPNNKDNFVDAVGYTALAGMLQLPEPGAPKKERDHARNVQKPVERINPIGHVPIPKEEEEKKE